MKYCCEACHRIASNYRLIASTEFSPDSVGRTDLYRHPVEGQILVLWDEDFDTRIWHFVDWLARGGLLAQCAMIGESQGTLSLVVKNYWEWRHVQSFYPQCSDGTTDHWPISLVALENENGAHARKQLAKWARVPTVKRSGP
jgi:hypothetical protein